MATEQREIYDPPFTNLPANLAATVHLLAAGLNPLLVYGFDPTTGHAPNRGGPFLFAVSFNLAEFARHLFRDRVTTGDDLALADAVRKTAGRLDALDWGQVITCAPDAGDWLHEQDVSRERHGYVGRVSFRHRWWPEIHRYFLEHWPVPPTDVRLDDQPTPAQLRAVAEALFNQADRLDANGYCDVILERLADRVEGRPLLSVVRAAVVVLVEAGGLEVHSQSAQPRYAEPGQVIRVQPDPDALRTLAGPELEAKRLEDQAAEAQALADRLNAEAVKARRAVAALTATVDQVTEPDPDAEPDVHDDPDEDDPDVETPAEAHTRGPRRRRRRAAEVAQ